MVACGNFHTHVAPGACMVPSHHCHFPTLQGAGRRVFSDNWKTRSFPMFLLGLHFWGCTSAPTVKRSPLFKQDKTLTPNGNEAGCLANIASTPSPTGAVSLMISWFEGRSQNGQLTVNRYYLSLLSLQNRKPEIGILSSDFSTYLLMAL